MEEKELTSAVENHLDRRRRDAIPMIEEIARQGIPEIPTYAFPIGSQALTFIVAEQRCEALVQALLVRSAGAEKFKDAAGAT
jgi:hypothetical protein